MIQDSGIDYAYVAQAHLSHYRVSYDHDLDESLVWDALCREVARDDCEDVI